MSILLFGRFSMQRDFVSKVCKTMAFHDLGGLRLRSLPGYTRSQTLTVCSGVINQIKYPSKPPYGVRCCPLDGTGRDPNLNKCHDESPPHDWPQFATRLPKLILTKHAALRNRSIGNALSKAKGPERVAAASEEVADGPDTRNAATEAVTGKQGAGAGWRHEAAIMPLQANTVLAVTVDNEVSWVWAGNTHTVRPA